QLAKDAPEGGADARSEETVALNPLDVFSNLDDLDFSGDADGLDDDIKTMLDDGVAAEGSGKGDAEAVGASEENSTAARPPPDLKGKLIFYANLLLYGKIGNCVKKLRLAVAWKENWWFYCDIVAALTASASLAVILSYYIWYRR
ncbi:MAG: hypothetical protein LBU23_05315, partial [Planctomycetota bacterium]|nr:hypothetical protein [Planctomycetota bacterium]